MNTTDLKGVMACISRVMQENKDYLIELDQQNGDGDLGISMSNGFQAVEKYFVNAEEKNLGKLFMKCSSVFNESAPSSLGTIISFGMIGMAKALNGIEEASIEQIAGAMEAGVKLIMERANSKPGEKTVLDALYPGVQILKENCGLQDPRQAFAAALAAATEGSESTKGMRSVHGRAAYYGDKSIGILDGGSVVGKLIFEGIFDYYSKK